MLNKMLPLGNVELCVLSFTDNIHLSYICAICCMSTNMATRGCLFTGEVCYLSSVCVHHCFEWLNTLCGAASHC